MKIGTFREIGSTADYSVHAGTVHAEDGEVQVVTRGIIVCLDKQEARKVAVMLARAANEVEGLRVEGPDVAELQRTARWRHLQRIEHVAKEVWDAKGLLGVTKKLGELSGVLFDEARIPSWLADVSVHLGNIDRSGCADHEPDVDRTTFKQCLSALINRHSKENGSDTPDFILARYLGDSLKAFDRATRRRDSWHGDTDKPTPPSDD